MKFNDVYIYMRFVRQSIEKTQDSSKSDKIKGSLHEDLHTFLVNLCTFM